MGKIYVFTSTVDNNPQETHEATGIYLHEWMILNVDGYSYGDNQPISAAIKGKNIPARYWPFVKILDKTEIELRLEPKDPVAIPAWAMWASLALSTASLAYSFLARKSVSASSSGTSGADITSASAIGNQAKLFGVVPEIFGRHIRYPDYLNQPRKYYSSLKQQSMDLMLCVGVGEYAINESDCMIGETLFSSYGNNLTYQFFEPGADVSGHQAHKCWYNAPEVGYTDNASGLTLTSPKASTASMTGTSYTISGENITIPIGSGSPPDDWDAGLIVSIYTNNIPFNIVDGGSNRDVVSGYFTKLNLSVGDTIELFESTGVNDGVYKIITYTAGDGSTIPDQITLDKWETRVISGVSTTGWFAAKSMTAGSYTGDIQIEGTRYEIQAIQTEFDNDLNEVTVGYQFNRLLPDGSDDSNWSGFQVEGSFSDVDIAYYSDGQLGNWIGPFSVCPSGEKTTLIEFDITAAGLGVIRDDGSIAAKEKTIEYNYRDLDNNGDWIVGYFTIAAGDADQLGWTEQVEISAMRPEFRMRRVGAEDTRTSAMDTLTWQGLKCTLESPTSYSGVTTLAMTLVGTSAVSSQTNNKINMIVTRKIPIVSGSLFTSTNEESRDIAPVARYIAQSVGYDDSQIDISRLVALDAIWKSRGDYFDYIYDSNVVTRDAINTALYAGFAEMTVRDGKITPVRDAPMTIEAANMYTPQNMTKALSRQFSAPTPDETDGVRVTYVDADTWEEATIDCLLDGDVGFKFTEITVDGVTDKDRAWRIGMWERRKLKYRRWTYTVGTEMDALNSEYWEPAVLADDVPGYGQTAIMEAFTRNSETQITIESSEPFTWADGESHVIAWRSTAGLIVGPFTATKVDEYTITATGLTSAIENPVVTYNQEMPHLIFGTTSRWHYPVIVSKISTNGRYEVSMEAVNYDSRVYDDYDNSPS